MAASAHKTASPAQLGQEAMANGDYDAAIAAFSAAIERDPTNPSLWEEAGKCYLLQKKYEHAILVFLKLARENPGKHRYAAYIAYTLQNYRITVPDPNFKTAIALCLSTPHLYHEWLYHGWASYQELAPEYAWLRELQKAQGQAFDALFDATDPTKLNDTFLLGGIARCGCSIPLHETYYKNLRRRLLDKAAANQSLTPWRPLLAALAQQNFTAEYVFSVSEDEQAKIKALFATLTDPKAEDGMLLYACYAPLETLRARENFAEYAQTRSKIDDDTGRVFKDQVVDFITEEALRNQIASHGPITDAVSEKVRGQYEENPYPRWRDAAIGALYHYPHPLPAGKLEVLIAGCGTGKQVAQAMQYQMDAHFTAIDLSRASLAYALRKARELGYASRVDFAQMDILGVRALNTSFDLVMCTGVLHHMDDPFKGWQAICDVLKPGGIMKIALYSELAREPLIEAREVIAKKGYAANPDGIRSLRDDMRDAPASESTMALLQSRDFYSMSACRDLLFHVQEHRYTVPLLADNLKRLGLEFLGFEFSEGNASAEFAAMFQGADARDLDLWHRFEQAKPDTFIAMYQFHARKKG